MKKNKGLGAVIANSGAYDKDCGVCVNDSVRSAAKLASHISNKVGNDHFKVAGFGMSSQDFASHEAMFKVKNPTATIKGKSIGVKPTGKLPKELMA